MTQPVPQPYDRAYLRRRLALANAVVAAAKRALTLLSRDEQAALQAIIGTVEAGQQQAVTLVDAYMAAKMLQATGTGTVLGLDPANYTISAIRGVPAVDVYRRAFNTLALRSPQPDGLARAQGALDKLVRTDLQLAQTHAARDWMTQQAENAHGDLRVVGYKRVLTGAGPHCRLCELAATRVYHVRDLMPIHEHCGCTVEPVWGRHDISSISAAVRVEIDPELGPRLMAEQWSPVGATVH